MYVLCCKHTYCRSQLHSDADWVCTSPVTVLRLDVWLTVILSIFISTTTMLHWLLHPRRGLLHLMLVNVVVASVLGITWVLVMTNEGR